LSKNEWLWHKNKKQSNNMPSKAHSRGDGTGGAATMCCLFVLCVIMLIICACIFGAWHCSIQSENKDCQLLFDLIQLSGYMSLVAVLLTCCCAGCNAAEKEQKKERKRNNVSAPSSVQRDENHRWPEPDQYMDEEREWNELEREFQRRLQRRSYDSRNQLEVF
jgi:hypothetical protein